MEIIPQGVSESCCERDLYQNHGCEVRYCDHRPSRRDDDKELLLGRMSGRRRRELTTSRNYVVIVCCGQT